jgi:bifunctional DNA-binding transcriptional regulator/antitoxin component of YhaV-PrlF toxin-antitoxin module
MKKIKLTETTGGSFKCVLPKELVLKLGWKDGDILEVTDRAGKMKLSPIEKEV